MPVPGPGYSITVRVEAPPSASAAGDLTGSVGRAGGVITAFDVVESHADRIVVDITCNALSADHANDITDGLRELPGVTVRKVSDRTFLVHLGGKIEVNSRVALTNRDDLSRAYTPGVARVCTAIAENPEDARRLTIKRNSVAVVTDGSAVLGLGNIGPEAALPVMEGKAALFKKFAGVNAWPVCLDTQDTEEIIRAVELIAPVYGGINLEDIAAPRCFEIERRLREKLNIPVFHDDQHGTAVVVLGALRNALRVVGKDLADCRVVVCGVGAAGSAIIRLLQKKGPADVIAVDIDGIVHTGRGDSDPNLQSIAANTNAEGRTGTLSDAVAGADVFIGVSAPNLLNAEEVATMNSDAIVFALANPDPEIDPLEAQKHAKVVATGRSDYPNQINNVLAFPGVFRGLLDAHAHEITDDMMIAASNAIADVVDGERLNASFIVPSVFDSAVAPAVADAVRKAATAGRTARPAPVGGSSLPWSMAEDLEY
ncbi:malate dehydrogenase (oxaloacetate-decarboxylating) [Saccharopolyspora erythraea NRRL 2338]|uniref:Malate dehydrogenase (Oxaloacetate-decarboxylating) n=2 Tax=Saccharopolyspora erythraea TaxID=1836 RepID=A4F785_SACEN|nr:NAD-dependent malic enzyme [Saccharopolyspora erythraea]EQD86353.1 malate dehydrogenase [Saccharopolyspora erythraea D]PFG93712.1 malate dehydrogenase (oxaloacetate-decarboxylating) [Saccharopolyspora erythraea NRRL 2338]QRK90554.1 NAD-dependent malic enzyme [Saccharopolyspora erythraea]CAL99909.1 malate dehydrogenase (oxaloacetate-decarboxylating) [Saccharopolyspora erythraea NRRL 2338]